MDVKASTSVWQNVEGLCESELLFLVSIHTEMSNNKDKDGVFNGSLLNIGTHVGILNFFKGKRLDFFCDLFESSTLSASVGHSAVILVEVDELLSLFPVKLHDFVVFVEEHVCDLLVIHFSLIFIS